MNNGSRLLKLAGRRGSPPSAVAEARERSRWEVTAGVLWGLVIVIVLARVALHPERNSVFGVFRLAGARWLNSQPLYPRAGQFLYSPLAAAIFAPFAWVPEPVASLVWRVTSTGPYALLAYAWICRTHRNSSQVRGVAWLVLLALSWGNLNNGQASPLVIALIGSGLWAAAAGRWNLAALAIAGATYFKLYPLAFGLLLAALYPRKILWRLVTAIAVLFLLSLLLQRPAYVLAQYHAWFSSLGADTRRLADGVGTWRDLWLVLRLLKVPITVPQYAFVQGLAGAGVALFCVWAQRVKRWEVDRLLCAVLAVGSCWVVLLGPATELATYIFLAPAFTVATAHLWSIGWRQRSTPQVIARALLAGTFSWLVTVELLNAWVPAVRRSIPLHVLQPVGALGFSAFVFIWLLDDRWWSHHPIPVASPSGVTGAN